jgi:hypothetical protein
MGKRFAFQAATTDFDVVIPVTMTLDIGNVPNTLAVVSVM